MSDDARRGARRDARRRAFDLGGDLLDESARGGADGGGVEVERERTRRALRRVARRAGDRAGERVSQRSEAVRLSLRDGGVDLAVHAGEEVSARSDHAVAGRDDARMREPCVRRRLQRRLQLGQVRAEPVDRRLHSRARHCRRLRVAHARNYGLDRRVAGERCEATQGRRHGGRDHW